MRLKLNVPRDFPTGTADLLATLDPDAELAAIDRDGERARRVEVVVG